MKATHTTYEETTMDTYRETAEDWGLWIEYVDPGAYGTEAEFDLMTVRERIEFMVRCFGPEREEE